MGYGMKYTKGGFPFKQDKPHFLEKKVNPTTKAVPSKPPKPFTDEEDTADSNLWQLEDKMKDEGVFSTGGQTDD